MIIELDASLNQITENLTEDGAVAIALDIIANAHREGSHVIFSEREVAEHLLKIGGVLNARTKQTLRHLFNRYTQLAEFSGTVQVKILVGMFADLSTEILDGQRLIKIPVGNITSGLLQKPYLLVENLDDAIFYKFITTELSKEINLAGKVVFEPYNGGGNTTGNVYAHIKQAGERLCLCIVDSDRRFPEASVGETASKVVASDRKSPSALAESFVLPVCSVENLVPFEFLRKAYSKDPIVSKRLDTYEPHHVDEVWPFFQLKKDIKCADLRQAKKSFSVFWAAKLTCEEMIKKCAESAGCQNRDDCTTTVLPAVSGGPLNKVLPDLTAGTLKPCLPVPTVKEAWFAIARLISAWACGGAQVAAS